MYTYLSIYIHIYIYVFRYTEIFLTGYTQLFQSNAQHVGNLQFQNGYHTKDDCSEDDQN